MNKQKTRNSQKPNRKADSNRKIRLRIAGVFVRDNKILLVKHRKNGLEYYLLPGGGQEPGESSIDALIREWKEELNLDIKPGQFLFCGESVPPQNLSRSQVMQLVFAVEEIQGSIHVKPDGALVGSDWIDCDELESIRLFPACLEQIQEYIKNGNAQAYSRYAWLS